MFTASDFVILGVSILAIIYFLGKRNVRQFTNTGIQFIYPVPFAGNAFKVIARREHLNDTLKRTYDKFPDEKYVGFFNFSQPCLVIKDLDLLKQVNVKDFDHFTDHSFLAAPESDPLSFHNLFNLTGDKWRDMRTTLSPTFTGSKMKEMLPFIEKCAERLTDYLKKETKKTSSTAGYQEIELNHILTKYSNDVIASCAFGIESDSLNDPDNTFYKMSEKITLFKGWDLAKFTGFFMCPGLMNLFKVSLMEDTVSHFFRSTVTNIMKSREESGVIRRDMIYLLMQAVKRSSHEENEPTGISEKVHAEKTEKNTAIRNWTDDEIAAQVVIFLFAGFDTVSTMLNFMFYELCINKEAHDLLQAEIDEYVLENNGAMATYNDLHKLKYLDMVCSETLRLWPPVGLVDRQCTKTFRLPPSNPGHPGYTIQKGDIIQIPIFPIHRDPKYWPNPEKFDPERFSDQNKSSIHPFTFLPFGVGPRACIGNRFALMEVKLLAFHLLRQFNLVMTPKTESPIKILSHIVTLTAENGFWIGIKRRNATVL